MSDQRPLSQQLFGTRNVMTTPKTASSVSVLTQIAAECHRSKWQFDDDRENLMPAADARRLVRRAFDELHRIGDLAMKERDAAKAAPQCGVQCGDVLGPCTQAELDAFEGLDPKSKQLFHLWVDRALEAERALALSSADCRTGLDWTLSEAAKQQIEEIDRNIRDAPQNIARAVSSTDGK